ncbi:MAG: multicopper oxidase domain-containing protein [Acidobacteriota bacterium]|nr:multicopper oxidase domain-containing protein [Acidobacteriota bacterium]
MKIKQFGFTLISRLMAVLTVAILISAAAHFASAQTKENKKGIEMNAFGRLVRPTIPVTPDVPNLPSELVDGVRTFRLTTMVFQHKFETFPKQSAEVWGYNGSIPGPTAIAYEGEKIRFIVTNNLPEPTTVHFHGLHQTNDNDGVAGVSQLNPINPGETYTYNLDPEHPGTFAYHAHFKSAEQELKGLDGMFVVLPYYEKQKDHVDRDFVFTLQSWYWESEGSPIVVFPAKLLKEFNVHTMNGVTRDAATEPTIRVGDKVRLRVYNVGNLFHAMHEHGFDLTVESQNGHKNPAPYEITTFDIGPGNFFEVTFVASKPGKWLFHCHVPHHTTNETMSGPDGSPVGMSRVFNVVN